jgi:iron complex outermembrane receptor protein
MRLSVVAAIGFLSIIGLSMAGESWASIKTQIDIPPQGLGPALQQLAKTDHFQIIFVSEEVSPLQTRGLVGEYTPEEALRQLLRGTRLTYRFLDETTIAVVRVATDSSVSTPPNAIHIVQANMGTVVSGQAVSDPPQDALEEIIVTSEKRAESAQKAPLAVSAVSGNTLNDRHVIDVGALAQMLPNVTFNDDDGATRIGIRGISFDNIDSTDAEARVAYLVDGIYISQSNNIAGTFFDVDRVEVVRGPQGTLFGRNAIAGAVSVITRDPTDTMEGYVQTSFGNYDSVIVQGAVGGPISDRVSFRIAGETLNHDGYGQNLTTGDPLDNLLRRDMRIKLNVRPTDDISILLSADYSKKDDNSGLYFGGYAIPGTVPPDGGLTSQPGNLRNSYADTTTKTYFEYYGVGADLKWNLGDGLELTSLTSARHGRETLQWDGDYTSLPLLSPAIAGDTNKQFSEELRLQQDFSRGHVLGGLYYFHEDYLTGTHVPINVALFGGPDFATNGTLFGGQQATNAFAAFAEGTYGITSALNLTVGGRFSDETKRATSQYSILDLTDPYVSADACKEPCNVGNLPAGSGFTPNASKTWTNFSPRVTLQYDLDSTKNVYLTYSRGFKSGGFNLGEEVSGQAFNPETLTDYEGGFKGDFLDHRVRANVAAFYYDYKNLQVSQILATPQAVLVNAAAARIYGLEFETYYVPIEHLRLDLAGSLMRSEFTQFLTFNPEFPNGPNGNDPTVPFNLAGNRLPDAPKYTATYGAQYTRAFPRIAGNITLRAEGNSISNVYFDQFNAQTVSADAFSLFNMFLNYKSTNGTYYGSLYVRNLTNVFRIAGATVSTGIDSFPIGTSFIPPRTYGVTFGIKF